MEMEQNLQDPHQDMTNDIEQSLNPRIISSTPTMENGNKKTQKKIGKKKVKINQFVRFQLVFDYFKYMCCVRSGIITYVNNDYRLTAFIVCLNDPFSDTLAQWFSTGVKVAS
jgi:hypothetical protein